MRATAQIIAAVGREMVSFVDFKYLQQALNGHQLIGEIVVEGVAHRGQQPRGALQLSVGLALGKRGRRGDATVGDGIHDRASIPT